MTWQFLIFIVCFLAILIAFIYSIVYLARKLHGRVPPRIYSRIELTIIAGIILGVVGMFQPWVHDAYRVGFYILLFSTLSFIVWSHITPAQAQDGS